MTKEIARLLVLTQGCSDFAKGIDWLYFLVESHADQRMVSCGYEGKDICIMRLLTILSRHSRDVRFYVVKDGEIAPYLVYFDFSENGVKLQMSFHSFDKRLRRFIKGSKKSRTEWRDDISSREVAIFLLEKYKLYKKDVVALSV